MLGVETALAVAITKLVDTGVMSLAQVVAALSWRPARIGGLDAHGHGLPVAAGNPANLCVFDPAEQWVVDRNRMASRSQEHPVRGLEAQRAGSPHRPTRPTHRPRPRGPVMSSSARSSPDPARRDGVRGGGDRRARCGLGRDRRGGVQHLAVGLPGDRHRPELRGPDHHVHVSAHRQLRHEPRRRREPPSVLSRGRSCATSPAARAAGARPSRSPTSSSATASPASPASTPAASPVTCATRVRFPARSAPTKASCAPRPPKPRRPTASTSPRRSPRDVAYTVGDPDAPFHVVAYDLGIKRTILRHLKGTRVLRRGRPRRHPGCRRARPQARRHLPLERSRRPGRGHRRRSKRCRAWSAAACRSSASASATRSSASRSVAAP